MPTNVLAFLGWDAATSSAVAAWLTASVAIAAGLVALNQLAEARRLRREQAQPYVAVYLEPSEAGSEFVELVIKNFGTTAALQVKLSITPSPERLGRDGPESLIYPKEIPVLVPDQSWRTYWDTSIYRDGALPDRHEATVSFSDTVSSNIHRNEFVLDWDIEKQRGGVVIFGSHHQAKATREIERHLRSWKEGPSGGGLKVWVRDGDDRDERVRGRRPQS